VLFAPVRIDHLLLVGTFCAPRKSVFADPAMQQRLVQQAGLSRLG